VSAPKSPAIAAYRARAARSKRNGLALPVVLLLVGMMLVTSSAWFESALFDARNAGAIADYLQSFHAADSALRLCARAVINGSIDVPPKPDTPGEPTAWLRQNDFDARATMPVNVWPGSARPPQCMIEGWQLDGLPDKRAYLVTARGFGASTDAQTWLQLQLVLDEDAVESHWRRVVGRPF
jgi:Tfp pilus assembly protein PilX